jgi:hypothetical protein
MCAHHRVNASASMQFQLRPSVLLCPRCPAPPQTHTCCWSPCFCTLYKFVFLNTLCKLGKILVTVLPTPPLPPLPCPPPQWLSWPRVCRPPRP